MIFRQIIRPTLLTILDGCLIIILIAGLTLSSCHRKRVSDEDVKALISEKIAVGTTIEEVGSFLGSHGIENLGYKEGLEPLFTPTVGQINPANKRFVVGRIRNVENRFLIAFDMYLIFYFDGNGRLIEYVVKRIGMGM